MEASQESKTVPTVSRVSGDTIVELVYDRNAHKTGLVVSRGGTWTIEQETETETGERLIPLCRHEQPHSTRLCRAAVRACRSRQQGGIDSDIVAYLHRYVDLSPLFEHIAAHYILLTWVHDAFNELPYLRFRGEYGTGKTRGLITIGSLATGRSSPAARPRYRRSSTCSTTSAEH